MTAPLADARRDQAGQDRPAPGHDELAVQLRGAIAVARTVGRDDVAGRAVDADVHDLAGASSPVRCAVSCGGLAEQQPRQGDHRQAVAHPERFRGHPGGMDQ